MTTAPETDRKHPVLNKAGVRAGWKSVIGTFMVSMIIVGLFCLFTVFVLGGLQTKSLEWFRVYGTPTITLTLFAFGVLIAWLLSAPFFRWYMILAGHLFFGVLIYLMLTLAVNI